MAKTFPYIEAHGSHREIGRAIGTSFKERIANWISERKQNIPSYDILLAKNDPYLRAANLQFPQFIDELTGIAEGAGVDFMDYFFLNNEELNNDNCTIAVSYGESGAIIGHNEDSLAKLIDHLYILKATVGDTTLLGLQDMMTLPGVSATMNSWGLVQCINSLHHMPHVGVPRTFLSRAILECRSLNEAETLIRSTNSASGYNHVLVQEGEIRNIEVSGNHVGIKSIQSKPFVHTNHFLAKEMEQFETQRSKSSVARLKRASELVRPNMTIEDMESLLRDTENSDYPICQPDATIGSVVFILNQRRMYVCYSHPCQGEYHEYTL